MSGANRRLMEYVRRHLSMLIAALTLSVMVGFLESALTLLIGSVVNMLSGGPTAFAFVIPLINVNVSVPPVPETLLLLLLVGATVAKAGAEYGGVTTTGYLGQAVVRDLRNDVFDRILHQPLQFFHRNPTGELISRVSTDIERIQAAASETLADFFKQSAITIFLLALVFAIDWKLTLSSLVLVPLIFYSTLWFGRKVRALSRSNQQELAGMSAIIYEAFSGNRIVKAFLMEDAENARFRSVTQSLFRINVRQKMTQALSSPLMETLGILVVASFVLYARSQRMSIALFTAFLVGLVKLYDAIRRMSGINNSFQQAFGASDRIFEILELNPEGDNGKVELTRFSGTVEFRDVRFGYAPGPPVLDGVSFDVPKGCVIAIVGPSGAGKTTLVNLAPRFFDASGGKILIDGVDVQDCTLQSLRRQMAIVTQDVILFDDTIRANISYGDPAASREAVLAAARAALVDEFVSPLPDGYETRIGERGLRLSGGERQRISIARALLKNAPILILDEATSSLDAESEVYVQRALQNLMEGRTTIVIAHRLSTVRRADRIIVLADGRVQESGPHEDLIIRKGLYWKLYNLQFEEAVRP